jgi:hypothetical protein
MKAGQLHRREQSIRWASLSSARDVWSMPLDSATTQGVEVPDICGKNVKDASNILAATGLGVGERKYTCKDIGVREGGRDMK